MIPMQVHVSDVLQQLLQFYECAFSGHIYVKMGVGDEVFK